MSSLATNYWRWQNVSQPPRRELLSPAIAHAQEGYVDSIQDPFTVLHKNLLVLVRNCYHLGIMGAGSLKKIVYDWESKLVPLDCVNFTYCSTLHHTPNNKMSSHTQPKRWLMFLVKAACSRSLTSWTERLKGVVAFIKQPITNQKDLDNEVKITMGRRRKKSREQSAGTYVLTRRERSAGGVSRIVESSAEFYNFYVGSRTPIEPSLGYSRFFYFSIN